MRIKILQTENYCICADESSYNCGQFHAISAICFSEKNAKELHKELKDILNSLNIKEFKWSNLNGDSKYTQCAYKFIDWVYKNTNNIRINTLIWNTNDYRHLIKNRDDDQNFAIMYYQNLNNLINKMPSNISYTIYPDEKHGFDWSSLEKCLSIKNDKIIGRTLFVTNPNEKFITFRNSINDIKPIKSNQCVFIQITDFFAGLAVYSYTNYERYKQWENKNVGQLSLLHEEQIVFSKSEKTRYKLLQDYKSKYHINMSLNKGLYTVRPREEKINFWLYKPQRIEDKAPVKSCKISI